jgi:hypothetical protein
MHHPGDCCRWRTTWQNRWVDRPSLSSVAEPLAETQNRFNYMMTPEAFGATGFHCFDLM